MSILLELFNRAVPWKISAGKKSLVRGQFTIDEYTYTVDMDGRWSPDIELGGPHEKFDDVWEVSFAIQSSKRFLPADSISDTGNALPVFTTVIDMISHVVEKHNIQTLGYSAANSEPSRVKLYNRMTKNFAAKGWRYIDNEELQARSDSYDGASPDDRTAGRGITYYLLTKHPPPAQQA